MYLVYDLIINIIYNEIVFLPADRYNGTLAVKKVRLYYSAL